MKKFFKAIGNFFKKIGLFIWKYLKICWNYIKENAYELHYTTEYYENMEDRMHKFTLLSESVKHCADGVGNASRETPEKSGQGNSLDRCFGRKDYAPSHSDIADHRKL